LFIYNIAHSEKNTEQPTEENKPEEQQPIVHHTSSELSSDIPLIAAFLDNLKFIIEYVASPTNVIYAL
jgi:hypothetical protein